MTLPARLSSFWISLERALILIVCTMSLIGMLGCGGGTSGTSVPHHRIVRGLIVSEDGERMENVTIRSLQGDARATTDRAGAFSLTTVELSPSFVLEAVAPGGEPFVIDAGAIEEPGVALGMKVTMAGSDGSVEIVQLVPELSGNCENFTSDPPALRTDTSGECRADFTVRSNSSSTVGTRVSKVRCRTKADCERAEERTVHSGSTFSKALSPCVLEVTARVDDDEPLAEMVITPREDVSRFISCEEGTA
jgi:hypothetical protein